MYQKICYIFLIFGQFQQLIAAYIEKDIATNPFIFYQEREINYEISERELSYQIDFSTINNLKRDFYTIQRTCPNSPYLQSLYGTLFYNKIWNKISFEKTPQKNIYPLEPQNLHELRIKLHHFNTDNDTETKCELLYPITKQLFALHYDFENLNKSTFSFISTMMPIETLLQDVHKLVIRSNLTTPLDFTHWFPTNLYKYTRTNFKIEKKYAYLTITIPLFEQATLSKIYPKPIFHNNIPYISNTRAEYLIESQTDSSYFTDINENCFYAINKTFCKKSKLQNECEKLFIIKSASKFEEKCFLRLPLQNVITQIKNDIYFLVINPMTIDVKCNASQQSIHIIQSSKIKNNECFVNSTFFTFDKNAVQDYGIYFSKSTEILNIWNENVDSKTLINFLCFTTFLFLYLIIFGVIAYYYYKIRSINASLNNVESIV